MVVVNQYSSLIINKFIYPVSCILSLFTNGPELDKNNKFTVKESDVVGQIFCSDDCNPSFDVRLKYSKRCPHKMGYYYYNVNSNITQIMCSSR